MNQSLSTPSLILLKALKKACGFQKPEDLVVKIHLSKSQIQKAIKEIKSFGYEIESKKEKGIRLVGITDRLFPFEITENLKTKLLGKNIYYYGKVGSTNDLGKRLAQTEAEEGTLILTEEQTKGKGRMGRSWHSPPFLGIWMSLILRPHILPSKAPGLSLCAGLALALSIKKLTGLDAKIKWPNDCLINKKKIGGILLELEAELDRINFVILGLGINVNQTQKDFPRHLRKNATSLRIELKRNVKRVLLLRLFLESFEKIYLSFEKHGLSFFKKRIKELSSVLGKNVELSLGRKKIKGKALDIDDDGSLLIESKGKKFKVNAGEVTLR